MAGLNADDIESFQILKDGSATSIYGARAMAGVIGSLQAMEAIKYIIGKGDLLTGRLLTYDALTMTFRTVKLPKNHECPVCGDHPTITKLIDYEQAECDMHM